MTIGCKLTGGLSVVSFNWTIAHDRAVARFVGRSASFISPDIVMASLAKTEETNDKRQMTKVQTN